jgi:molecular chaperone GrpE
MSDEKEREELDNGAAETDIAEDAVDQEMTADAGSEEGGAGQSATEAMRAELARMNDLFLRQAAEFQNFRRRTERDRMAFYASGKVEAIRPLLDIMDDFERTVSASEGIDSAEPAVRSLIEGVNLIYRKLADTLKALGVHRIEAKGMPFTEDEHEAMLQQPAPEGVEPGTVIDELQAGYRLDDRVLRHSKVIVAN